MLLRSETYVTILKYIDLWGETLPETLFRPWESTGGAASASGRAGSSWGNMREFCYHTVSLSKSKQAAEI